MKPKKVCFVTVGATASFDSLIRAALSTSFLQALKATNYTDLLLQYGKDGALILEAFDKTYPLGSDRRFVIYFAGFDFKLEGGGKEMQPVMGEWSGVEGVVLSHAGTPLNNSAPYVIVLMLWIQVLDLFCMPSKL